jgi:hypothetical protein
MSIAKLATSIPGIMPKPREVKKYKKRKRVSDINNKTKRIVEETGHKYTTIRQRLEAGWTEEEAKKPVMSRSQAARVGNARAKKRP